MPVRLSLTHCKIFDLDRCRERFAIRWLAEEWVKASLINCRCQAHLSSICLLLILHIRLQPAEHDLLGFPLLNLYLNYIRWKDLIVLVWVLVPTNVTLATAIFVLNYLSLLKALDIVGCLGWHTSLVLHGGQSLWSGRPGWWFNNLNPPTPNIFSLISCILTFFKKKILAVTFMVGIVRHTQWFKNGWT